MSPLVAGGLCRALAPVHALGVSGFRGDRRRVAASEVRGGDLALLRGGGHGRRGSGRQGPLLRGSLRRLGRRAAARAPARSVPRPARAERGRGLVRRGVLWRAGHAGGRTGRRPPVDGPSRPSAALPRSRHEQPEGPALRDPVDRRPLRDGRHPGPLPIPHMAAGRRPRSRHRARPERAAGRIAARRVCRRGAGRPEPAVARRQAPPGDRGAVHRGDAAGLDRAAALLAVAADQTVRRAAVGTRRRLELRAFRRACCSRAA